MLGAIQGAHMASKKNAWAEFPHDAKGFDFAADKLRKAWPALHAGDGEPYPDEQRAASLIKAAGKAGPKGIDAATLASRLQDAWRAFHRGDFQLAFDTGWALGPAGASVAVKAIGIHATYLVDDEAEQIARFQRAIELAEQAKSALPGEANSHYRHAFALGRYSQRINIAKALQMGLAGKVRESLDLALKLDGKHAEAHTALALYHAEIIGKIGALIGGMTYGKKEDAAASAFEKASKLKPRDAMEKLDAEYAREQIE